MWTLPPAQWRPTEPLCASHSCARISVPPPSVPRVVLDDRVAPPLDHLLASPGSGTARRRAPRRAGSRRRSACAPPRAAGAGGVKCVGTHCERGDALVLDQRSASSGSKRAHDHAVAPMRVLRRRERERRRVVERRRATGSGRPPSIPKRPTRPTPRRATDGSPGGHVAAAAAARPSGGRSCPTSRASPSPRARSSSGASAGTSASASSSGSKPGDRRRRSTTRTASFGHALRHARGDLGEARVTRRAPSRRSCRRCTGSRRAGGASSPA